MAELHNAIPREAQALCAVPMKDKESVRVDLNIYTAELENEYAATEPNLRTELSSESPCKEAIDMTTAGHLSESCLRCAQWSVCHESGYSGISRNFV